MSKKSKAKRAEGFKEAADAVKQINRNKKDVTVSVGARGVVPNFSVSARDTAEKRDNRREGRTKYVKGILKGIFNNPGWWSNFSKPKVAINENRPMDPGTLASFNDNIAGMGVGNVVDIFFGWKDISTQRNFRLVTQEAFQAIREELKSNLPYDITTFRSYLLASMSVSMMCETLSRSLGWYTFTRDDVPYMADYMKMTANAAATGLAKPAIITALDDDHIARSLTKEVELFNQAKLLVLPKTMQEVIKWLFGTMFFDQTAQNFQMYRTWCTSIPYYQFEKDGQTIKASVKGYLDGRYLDIDTVVDYVLDIVDIFGVTKADIAKTNGGAYVPVHYTMHTDVKQQPVYDTEFFNMIINGYTDNLDNIKNSTLVLGNMSNVFFRIDFMPEIPEDSKAGTLQSLGAVLAVDSGSPLYIISQGVLLHLDDANVATSYGLASNGNIKRPSVIPAEYKVNDIVSLTYDSNAISTDTISTNFNRAGTNALAYRADFNNANPVVPPSGVTACDVSNQLFTLVCRPDIIGVVAPDTASNIDVARNAYVIATRTFAGPTLTFINGSNTYEFAIAFKETNSQLTCRLYIYDKFVGIDPSKYASTVIPTGTNLAWDYAMNGLNGYGICGTRDYGEIIWTISNATGVRFPGETIIGLDVNTFTTLDVIRVLLSHPSVALSGPVDNDLRSLVIANFRALVTWTSATGDGNVYQATDKDTRLVPFFVENVDFHIPLFKSDNVTVFYYDTAAGEDKEYHFYNDVQLLKECYIPALYNTIEADTLLYNMWASALRIKK